MDVSIVMINYNTYDLTVNALESIFQYTKKLSYEIVLIDNASPDNSGELLKQKYGDKIKYISSSVNLGTAKAFNLGYKNSTGKYILWLNTDILVYDNFIFDLFDFMQNNESCGICGGNLLDFNRNPTHSYKRRSVDLKTIRRDYSIFHTIFRKVFKKSLSLEYNYTNQPLEVGFITGADMMIRKSVLDEIGPFCDEIFMYGEDSEFAYRMKKRTSYRVMSVPYAKMLHLEGASFSKKKSFNENKYRISTSGVMIYFEKCFSKEEVIRYLKQCRRSYLKFMVICKIIFKNEKAREYQIKRKICKEYLDSCIK